MAVRTLLLSVPPSVYQQAVQVLARIDESLALCGTDKSRVLTATIYLADVTRKAEFNRAWDEWVDSDHPPMRACIGVAIEPPHLGSRDHRGEATQFTLISAITGRWSETARALRSV